MSLKTSRLAAASAMAAAFSLAATSVSAAQLPPVATASPYHAQVYDRAAGNVAHSRDRDRYRDDYRHRDRYRHDRGISTGGVIAGLLILGGIAAVASAASDKDDHDDRDAYPVRRPYPEDARYEDARYGAERGRGIDNAVDMCVAEVERDSSREHVRTVDNADRTADGWNVGGTLESGDGFTCWIGNDGRISDISINRDWQGETASYRPAPVGVTQDNQWDDEYYARARAAQSEGRPG